MTTDTRSYVQHLAIPMKMVRIITISREYGSGGGEIGQELAKRLRWKFLDRELILEIARRAHVQPSQITSMDEHPSSFIARLLKGFWRGNEFTWSGPIPEVIDPYYLAQLSAIVIHEAAKLGSCVIVGRGAQCILQNHDDAFHVFVYGSCLCKFERIQERHRTEADRHRALVEVDTTRAAFIRQNYHCDWADRRLYDLMISSDMGIDRASTAILAAARLAENTALRQARVPEPAQVE